MNLPLSISPSKEMGDRTRQRKKSLNLAGIEPPTSGFDCRLFYRLSYEARREQVGCDNGSTCNNVNVKGTSECCTTSTKDTDDLEIIS